MLNNDDIAEDAPSASSRRTGCYRLTPNFNPPNIVVSALPGESSSLGLQLHCIGSESCGLPSARSQGPFHSHHQQHPGDDAAGNSRKRKSSEFSLFDGEIDFGNESSSRSACTVSKPFPAAVPATTTPGPTATQCTASRQVDTANTVSSVPDKRVTLKELMSAASSATTKKAHTVRPPTATSSASVNRSHPHPTSTLPSTMPNHTGASTSTDTVSLLRGGSSASGSAMNSSKTNTTSVTGFVKSDFDHLGEVCRNIAASSVSVEHFCKKFGIGAASRDSRTSDVVVSLLWHDLTTNHMMTGPLIGEQVRAQAIGRDRNPVLGLLVLLSDEPQVVYLLPLATCVSDQASAKGKNTVSSSTLPLPLQCGVPYIQRWQLATTILCEQAPLSPRIQPRLKIMHNIQLLMLSLLSYSSYQPGDTETPGDGGICGDNQPFHYTPGDLAGLLNCGCYEGLLQLSLLQSPSSTAATLTSRASIAAVSSSATTLVTPGDAPHSFLPLDPKIVGFICDDSNSNKETVSLDLVDLFFRFNISHSHAGSASTSQGNGQQGRVTLAIRDVRGEMVSLLELGKVLHAKLITNPPLYRYYCFVELPLLELLSCMERNGIPIDRDYMVMCESELKQAMETVTGYAKDCVVKDTGDAGHRQFNIASPEQVSNILYNVLQVKPPTGVTGGHKAKKFISTAEEDLLRITDAHPFVGYVLQYRALAKVVHTYIEGIYPFIVTRAGRHVTTDSCSTSSGRSSSSSDGGGIERFFGSSVGSESHLQTTAGGRSSAHNQTRLHSQTQYRLHPQWHVTSVRTGRLSCSKPNLQSLPNPQVLTLHPQDTSKGRRDQVVDINLRTCIVTSTYALGGGQRQTLGRERRARSILISADYSQIEMRLLAHISGDRAMIQLFNAGGKGGSASASSDIYRQLAVAILGQGHGPGLRQGGGSGSHNQFVAVDPVAVANVTDAQRSQAKVVTLGVMYGMGPQAAAQKLSISIPAVKNITAQFFQQFSGVHDWMNEVKNGARQSGYVSTMLGRRRYLPDINPAKGSHGSSSGHSYGSVATAERQAINTVIQGSASELIKMSMLLIQSSINNHSRWSDKQKFIPTLRMQIHDELIYEVPLSDSDDDGVGDQDTASADAVIIAEFVALLRECMEGKVGALFHLSVPLIVNIQASYDSWGTFQKYGKPTSGTDITAHPCAHVGSKADSTTGVC